MKLSNEAVRDIALEARLLLNEEELQQAADYMNNFLSMLDRFRELDLSDVEPFCFAESNSCPLRADRPVPFPDVPSILEGSVHQKDGYFKVPRIMGE